MSYDPDRGQIGLAPSDNSGFIEAEEAHDPGGGRMNLCIPFCLEPTEESS